MTNGDDESDDAADGPREDEEATDQPSGEDTTTNDTDDIDEPNDGEATDNANDESSDADDADDESSDADDADDESSDADEETADTADEDDELETTADGEDEPTVESLDDRLDAATEQIEDAETEDELDRAEETLEEIEADLETADLPEPDQEGEGDEGSEGDGEDGEDDGGDEDEAAMADPREGLESRIAELRETIEEKRGPYAEDAIEEIEGAKSTIEETRWTQQGRSEVIEAVSEFLNGVEDPLDESFEAGEEIEDQPPALSDVIDALEAASLDPDDDADTIESVRSAAEELREDLDAAEAWDDLSVREKLDAQGFYDVLTPENRKDFPPEWNAVKIYERGNDPEPILLALDQLDSNFMEAHCIESLKRLGAPEAYDEMEARAQKRNKPPIEVLGKIGDARALETLHEYIEGESDPALQKVTLKAIGEIGSADSTQAVADRLVAENESVRSRAARALGLIGDTRAVAPLSDVLEDNDSDSVRASAAWSLNQIGTQDALDAASEHAEDRSYLVQSEAERAATAAEDEPAENAA